MSASSIIHTVEVPAFDSATGQLSLDTHHLLSAPLGYSHTFSPQCALLFDAPPTQAYDSNRVDDSTEPPKKRKRRKLGEEASPADWALQRERKDKTTTTTDRESEEHHKSVVLHLEGAIDAIRESWLNRGERSDWTGIIREEDKRRIKWAEKEQQGNTQEVDLVGAVAGPSREEVKPKVIHLDQSTSSRLLSSLVGNVNVNQSRTKELVSTLKEREEEPSAFRLVLPPSSGFLLSNFDQSWSSPDSSISQLAESVGAWDILVMDPPWPNASATRSGSYETFDPYDLWKLDVPTMLGKKKPVLVAIWLTNRVKYRRLLLDKLFPAWKISNPVEWFWVKIASETGEPVWSLDSSYRRCYEGLVLGWYTPRSDDEGKQQTLPRLPEKKVFLSTPIGHSRKPVLLDLLIALLPPSQSPPNVLELFARTTLAGPMLASTTMTATSTKTSEVEPVEVAEERSKRGFFLAVGNESIKFNLCVGGKSDKDRNAKGWIELDEGEEAERESVREEGEGISLEGRVA